MASLFNQSISTTEKSLYIVEYNSPQERLEIQFVPPVVEYNATANQAKIDVVGRNNPLYHYINGEDDLKLSLDFHAEDEQKYEVLERVNWLLGLRYNDGRSRRKKNVLIVFGEMFLNRLWTVTSVNVKYSEFRSDAGFRPQQATVDIQFKLDPPRNIVQSDFR